MFYFSNSFSSLYNYLFPSTKDQFSIEAYEKEILSKQNPTEADDALLPLLVRVRELVNTNDRFNELNSFGKWDSTRINQNDYDQLKTIIVDFAKNNKMENDPKIGKILDILQTAHKNFERLLLNKDGTWFKLPKEMKIKVLSFVPDFDILHNVSRRDRVLVNDFWRKLCLDLDPQLVNEPSLPWKSIYKELNPKLESLQPYRGTDFCIVTLSYPCRNYYVDINSKTAKIIHLKRLLNEKYSDLDINKMKFVTHDEELNSWILNDDEKVEKWFNVTDQSECGFRLIMKK
jgi:hypothetical protein